MELIQLIIYISHSYIIDLNDYIDIDLYKNYINSNYIDFNNLNYTLLDLSYVNEFNLFAINSQENIIYNKIKIIKLNTIQRNIYILNFKLIYLNNLLFSVFENQNNFNYFSNSIQNIRKLSNFG